MNIGVNGSFCSSKMVGNCCFLSQAVTRWQQKSCQTLTAKTTLWTGMIFKLHPRGQSDLQTSQPAGFCRGVGQTVAVGFVPCQISQEIQSYYFHLLLTSTAGIPVSSLFIDFKNLPASYLPLDLLALRTSSSARGRQTESPPRAKWSGLLLAVSPSQLCVLRHGCALCTYVPTQGPVCSFLQVNSLVFVFFLVFVFVFL